VHNIFYHIWYDIIIFVTLQSLPIINGWDECWRSQQGTYLLMGKCSICGKGNTWVNYQLP
jgi:hypothetical protein